MNDECGTMNAEPPLIEINSRVMLGKPVVRGTRITVALIVEKLVPAKQLNSFSLPIPT